jgi:uncharacterized phage-like protein YoqJ
MIDKNKTLCFSGHRTDKLPKSSAEIEKLANDIYAEINKAILDGYDTFLFGACYGFDLMCAEQVLFRKRVIKLTDPVNIKLIAVVPFEDQAVKWKESDRFKYYNILSKCDDVIIMNKQYKDGCYHERNRYMVDNSTRLVCYYNGSEGGTKYTVEYAIIQNVSIINLYENIRRLIN